MKRSPQQEAISKGLKTYWKGVKSGRRRRPDVEIESEEILHRRVAEFLDTVIHPPNIWTTIGHGGGGKVRGAKLKAMGVKKGWPDILILAPGPKVLGIELKKEGGYLSPEQKTVGLAFYGCQSHYVLCRSVEDVNYALRILKRPA